MIDPSIWSEEVYKQIIRTIVILTISGFWIVRSWRNHWYLKKDNWKRFKKILGLSPPLGEFVMYLHLARTVDFLKFADDLSFIANEEGNYYEVFLRIQPLLNPDIEVEFQELIERSFEDVEEEDIQLLYEDWEFVNESLAKINLQAWYTNLSRPTIEHFMERYDAVRSSEGFSEDKPSSWMITPRYFLPAKVFDWTVHDFTKNHPEWHDGLQTRYRNLRFISPVIPNRADCYDLRVGYTLDIYFNDANFFATWLSKSDEAYFKVYSNTAGLQHWRAFYYKTDQWQQRLDRLQLRISLFISHPYVQWCWKRRPRLDYFTGVPVWFSRLPTLLKWNEPKLSIAGFKSHEITRWENASLIKWEFNAPPLIWSRVILDTDYTTKWHISKRKHYVFSLMKSYLEWLDFFYNVELPILILKRFDKREDVAEVLAAMGEDEVELFKEEGMGSWWFSDTKYLAYRNYSKDLKREKKEERIFLDKVLEFDETVADLGNGLIGARDRYWEPEHSFEARRFQRFVHPAQIPPIYGIMYRSVRNSTRVATPGESLRTGFSMIEVERFYTPELGAHHRQRHHLNSDSRLTDDAYFETLQKQNNLRVSWFDGTYRPDSVQLLQKLKSIVWPFFYSRRQRIVTWAKHLYEMLEGK